MKSYLTTAILNSAFAVTKRNYSQSIELNLKDTLKSVIPEKRDLLKKVKSHAGRKIGDVKVENTVGGMR